jgi:hypothetical protein
MAKTTIPPKPTTTKRRSPRRKPWGFEPRIEQPAPTTFHVMVDALHDGLEDAIGAFVRERFNITWGGTDWQDEALQKYGPLGDELAAWIARWVKTRDGLGRRLGDLLRMSERAAIYREHHAPDSPLDREAWARRRLARLGRKAVA